MKRFVMQHLKEFCLAGGLILVLMGLKILFEHLGYLNF